MGILTRRNIRKAKGLYPRPPCDCREVFSCGEGLPRQAVAQPTDKRHSRPSGASSVVKGENEIRACSPDRVFVMKNRTFVEFISKIRAAWLFLHIANKKLVPMRIKSRTSGLMQTPREISHTGNPTGGAGAHSAVLPAAHEATDNPDNIFYRTIRTAMKKQLISIGIGVPAGRRMLHGKQDGRDGVRHPGHQLHGRHVDRHGFGRGFRHARSARKPGLSRSR